MKSGKKLETGIKGSPKMQGQGLLGPGRCPQHRIWGWGRKVFNRGKKEDPCVLFTLMVDTGLGTPHPPWKSRVCSTLQSMVHVAN